MSKEIPLAEEHPELFHYTSVAGLVGIIQNQTLWASHYGYSNDAQEVKHFFDVGLPNLLPSIPSERIQALANKIFDDKEPLAEPYILSFCTPQKGDNCERVKANGLLSQWRGYAHEGGYAIVFDTEKLSTLLTRLAKEKWNEDADLFGGDVVYSSDSEEQKLSEFGQDLKIIKSFFFEIPPPDETMEKIYIALMRCACRYKHWGFKEENEVRFIAIPQSDAVRGQLISEGIPIKEIPIKHFQRSGTLVPYIDLFEGITKTEAARLPIKRIIVGPCSTEQEQKNKVRAVKGLLNQHKVIADVIATEIPYRK